MAYMKKGTLLFSKNNTVYYLQCAISVLFQLTKCICLTKKVTEKKP